MKPDFIDKLPPDAQKEFLKLAMKLDEKTKHEKDHKDFLAFVRHVSEVSECFLQFPLFFLRH